MHKVLVGRVMKKTEIVADGQFVIEFEDETAISMILKQATNVVEMQGESRKVWGWSELAGFWQVMIPVTKRE